MNPRVLLVGMDGAEPSLVSSLLDAGALPHFDRVVENGCVGTLRARAPLVRAMQWTTLATGMRAPAHGVCGDVEVREDQSGVRRTTRASWRVPAVWDLLASAGLRCTVVGWPGSAPAARHAGVRLVDDAFAEPLARGFEAWPATPGAIAPAELREALRHLRVHPSEMPATQLDALVPLAGEAGTRDPRLNQVSRALARAASVHAAATHLAVRRDWDFLAVTYSLLGEVQRDFLRFHPPAAADAASDDARLFAPLVERAYRLQDRMLGRLVQCAGPDTTVLVVSPYGFATREERPSGHAAATLPPSIAWHRPSGLVAASGPAIAVDALIHGACTEDIVPTVLNLFGLRAAGLDGRCLAALAPIHPHARPVPAQALLPPPFAHATPARLEAAQRRAVERAQVAALRNTAEAHLAALQHAEAAVTLREVVARCPGDWIAKARLARCLLALGEHREARALAADVAAARPDDPWGHLLHAAAGLAAGDDAAVEADLAHARRRGRGMPCTALRLGLLHLLREEWHDAEALFREALRAARRTVEAFDGLACALHGQGRFGEAAAALREGLAQQPDYALAQLHLASALAALGRFDEAEAEARAALEQDAAMPGVDMLLAHIARSRHAAAGRR